LINILAYTVGSMDVLSRSLRAFCSNETFLIVLDFVLDLERVVMRF